MISTAAELSDLQGAQEPRLCHIPDFGASSGQEAVELARMAGLYLDPWQEFVLVNALGERDDGKWAAFEVGLVVPRQNGKGSILEARELAGLFLFGERLLIHSAHEQATSSEHFRRLLALIEGVPEFSRRVRKAVHGKGSEAIELTNGQRILFKTRTGGGGRGLTGDFVALDEAMILPDATTAALVPTMAARSLDGNPQLWYAGSAVDQVDNDNGVVLSRVRGRGLAGGPRIAYFEWSAEGDDPQKLTDEDRRNPEAWAAANPGLGLRIAAEHVANECDGALGPRKFAVERLGVGDWPDPDGASGVIDLEVWAGLEDPTSLPVDPLCFAFDVTPDRLAASIALAGRRDDGLFHIETDQNRGPGTGWLVKRLTELVEKHGAVQVLCDGSSPAASLLPELEQAAVLVEPVAAKEHGQACGFFFDQVDQRTLRHLNTPDLSAALAGAMKRPLVDAWAWSRKSSAVDISPLVAATLALWGIGGAPSGGGFEW